MEVMIDRTMIQAVRKPEPMHLIITSSAAYAARCTLSRSPLWTETLRRHTGFSKPELKECAKVLVSRHIAAPEGKLNAIYKKYSRSEHGAVALHPPVMKVVEESKETKARRQVYNNMREFSFWGR